MFTDQIDVGNGLGAARDRRVGSRDQLRLAKIGHRVDPGHQQDEARLIEHVSRLEQLAEPFEGIASQGLIERRLLGVIAALAPSRFLPHQKVNRRDHQCEACRGQQQQCRSSPVSSTSNRVSSGPAIAPSAPPAAINAKNRVACCGKNTSTIKLQNTEIMNRFRDAEPYVVCGAKPTVLRRRAETDARTAPHWQPEPKTPGSRRAQSDPRCQRGVMPQAKKVPMNVAVNRLLQLVHADDGGHVSRTGRKM